MAQLLQAPTEGYEDEIVVPAITADNFELKHGLVTLVQNTVCPHHGFLELHQLDTFYNALNSKDQDSLNFAACVSMNTSTSGISPDVAEHKDMVKALLLDKKSQNQAPATVKAVEESSYQAPAYQARAPQTQGVSKEDFSAYIKANDAVMRNMQTQGQNMQNQLTNLAELLTKFVNTNNASTSSSDNEPEATKNTVHPTNNRSTEDVQPQVVQSESLILTFEPVNSPVSASRPNLRPSIPYPSRLQDHFADALILMPKFGPSIKSLLTNKDKPCELARTPLNEHCLAVLLKKLPKKLGDPGKFLIPCDFPRKAECLALADLDASINLMPLSVWNKLSLNDLTPTYMTLELVDRSISHPVGVAEDAYVKVGTFHFPTDFVVVDFDADPRVPLILERSFLKTRRALINVFEGELTLRVGKEAITFNLDQTSRYSANYNEMTAKQINDMACEEYSQEVLIFLIDFLLEEVDAFLALEDDPTSPEVNQSYLDSEGDILLEAFLNDDPLFPPPKSRKLSA
nr:reverse transcriptase domain-containing protein [Tanacetum cinerariifolium]